MAHPIGNGSASSTSFSPTPPATTARGGHPRSDVQPPAPFVAPSVTPSEGASHAHAVAETGPDVCLYDDVLVAPATACVLHALLAALPPGPYQRALAVQAGSAALALNLPAAQVLCCDTSRPLLGRAQKRLAHRNDRSRFALWHGNFERLPHRVARGQQQEAFDLVFVDGLRLPAGAAGGQTPLRLAIDAQLAPGGVLLVLEPQHAPLPTFAYTCLQRLPFAVEGRALQATSYLR